MEALDDAAALKDQCVHPTEGGPYVRSFKAGKDNSEENLQVYPILVPFISLIPTTRIHSLFQKFR